MIVVDDFLTNAAATRAYALTLDFAVRGNYPGARTRSFADASWVPWLERYLPSNEKITWFDCHPFSYNGSFQLCTAADGNSWIHRDCTDWAGVLFLGPPDAPLAGGLTLYRHRATRALGGAGLDPKTLAALDADAADPANWEAAATAGNVFNRLVLFRGDRFHKSSAYFGGDRADGRVFQVLFFNTRSPPLARWNLARPRVALVVFSTNRYDYLESALDALARHVDLGGCLVQRVLVDDWPAARDDVRGGELARRHNFDRVVRHETNLGLGRTWRETWDWVRESESVDWVLHLEEDAVFERPVVLRDVIAAYADSGQPLTQVFFKRNVCYEPSRDFIARIESGELGDDLPGPVGVSQNAYFVAMASVYPRLLVQRFASENDPHEHTVRDYFKAWGMASGMWGGRRDAPVVRHVGEVSRGLKVSENDAAYADFAGLPREGDYHFATGALIAPPPAPPKPAGAAE